MSITAVSYSESENHNTTLTGNKIFKYSKTYFLVKPISENDVFEKDSRESIIVLCN